MPGPGAGGGAANFEHARRVELDGAARRGLDARMHAAAEAVWRAGRLCRYVQRGAAARAEGPERIIKSDGSPVTIGDYGAAAVIARELNARGMLSGGAAGKGARLISEEDSVFLRRPEGARHVESAVSALRASGAWADATGPAFLDAIDLASRAVERDGEDEHGPFWAADPIDGTKGFVRGQQYAVCLALVERGQPVVAAIACPNLSNDPARGAELDDGPGIVAAASASDREPGVIVWSARDGGGAAESGKHVALDDLRCERAMRLPGVGAGGVRVARSPEHGHSDRSTQTRVINGLGDAFVSHEVDGQGKYVMVALGRAEVYLRIPPRAGARENVWDHAPGVLIAERGGAAATDAHGAPLWFGGSKLSRSWGIVAAEPETHQKILRVLEEMRAGRG